MVTAFYTDSASQIHNLPGHPEHAGRLHSVLARLDTAGLRAQLNLVERIPITDEDLARVHHAEYLRLLERVSQMSESVMLEADTYLVPETYEIARQTVGGACAVANAVMTGEAQNGLVAARPPGHHATPQQGMGFCLLSNVALMARYIQANYPEIERVAIIDFDVHHGNGTQGAFWDDPSVLFISSHQSPLYPGTGGFNEIGRGAGRGYTLNLPISPRTDDDYFIELYKSVVQPALEKFAPQFMIVSAGFDAHWRDPLAQVQLSLTGLAQVSRMLMTTAQNICNGRIVFVMEGGYDLEVLAHGIENVAHGLLGADTISDPLGQAAVQRPMNMDTIQQFKEGHLLFQAE